MQNMQITDPQILANKSGLKAHPKFNMLKLVKIDRWSRFCRFLFISSQACVDFKLQEKQYGQGVDSDKYVFQKAKLQFVVE